MAKRIIWSSLASEIFNAILFYYFQRNGNKAYSRKLNATIKRTVTLLSQYPNLGKPTEINTVREFSDAAFKIIYQIRDDEIVILMVWDTRQNPEDLNLDNLIKELE